MKKYPIELGTLLFTMVEPNKGHEVEYNRWYERDHFYGGVLVGAYSFAGDRFVSTRDLKALRYPVDSPMTPDPMSGSYLAIYWVLKGHHDDWNRWSVDTVKNLHATGRMFAERTHIHTQLYDNQWSMTRTETTTNIELALDRGYPGIIVNVGELNEGVTHAQMSEWMQTIGHPEHLLHRGDQMSSTTQRCCRCLMMHRRMCPVFQRQISVSCRSISSITIRLPNGPMATQNLVPILNQVD
jgi:hypothetical protein